MHLLRCPRHIAEWLPFAALLNRFGHLHTPRVELAPLEPSRPRSETGIVSLGYKGLTQIDIDDARLGDAWVDGSHCAGWG